MTKEAIIATFGEEYPAAVFTDGTRLLLIKETRWKRFYTGGKFNAEVSRLMDGSTSFTLKELQKEWPTWMADERDEFKDALNCAKIDSNISAMRDFVGLPKNDLI
jgi:hypothetical protein